MLSGKHKGDAIMPKTHQFTRNTSGQPVEIVIDKIATFDHDEFSECTIIVLVGGDKIGVSESVEDVRAIVKDA